MLGFVKIRCYFCHKQFYKEKRHFNWSKKLDHNSFCSKGCQYSNQKTGKWLVCENLLCRQGFYRVESAVLDHNYCSKSCAAIVNNQKYPKWPARYCTRKGCKNIVKRVESPYCSIECGKLARFKYTKEEIVEIIQKYFKNNSRIPPKREVREISHKAIHLFDSWNNAILAAGLIPNRSQDNRMYKRISGKALDGHPCDSASEILIDNWLHKNRIDHERNSPYPTTNHKSDWSIKNGKIFVEYFGLAKDSPRYDRSIKEKIKICRENKIKLVAIYPKNLYPINKLDKVLVMLL
ncbi:MAG: hypothetical protein Q8Q89_03545 [bacterium]|nr:hypothetical protein [bacterium]